MRLFFHRNSKDASSESGPPQEMKSLYENTAAAEKNETHTALTSDY